MSGGPNITVELIDVAIVVKFGGIVHIWISDRRNLVGIQSWRIENINRYFIEFTMEGGTITSDYDDATKWRIILDGLEKIL